MPALPAGPLDAQAIEALLHNAASLGEMHRQTLAMWAEFRAGGILTRERASDNFTTVTAITQAVTCRQLIGSQVNRLRATILNTGANPAVILPNVDGNPADGFLLAAGASLTLRSTAAVYFTTPAGAVVGCQLSVLVESTDPSTL